MTNNSINTGSQIIQYKYSNTASTFAITTIIPNDDTIPQNTEGVEILTVTITPKYSTSTLLLEFNAQMTTKNAVSSTLACALFQDTTASSLGAVSNRPEASSIGDEGTPINLVYAMASGTTSSTTFKIRAGGDSTAVVYINANSAGTRLMGGVSYATFSVTEYY